MTCASSATNTPDVASFGGSFVAASPETELHFDENGPLAGLRLLGVSL